MSWVGMRPAFPASLAPLSPDYGDEKEHGERDGKERGKDRPHLPLHEFDHYKLTGPNQVANEQKGPIAKTGCREH